MTLKKTSFLLILPLVFTLVEYTFVNKRLPSDRRIVKYLESKSFLNLKVKMLGSWIKSLIGSRKLGNICYGNEEYLFYCPKKDGDPIADLYGENNFSNKHFIMPLEKALTSYKDRVFYLTIPNKSRYLFRELFINELMEKNDNPPWKSIKDDELLNPDQYFSVGQILTIFEKNKGNYYFKQDTHWNQFGAYELIQNLKIDEISEKLDFQPIKYYRPDMLILLENLGKKVKSIDFKYEVIDSKITQQGDSNTILVYKNSMKKNQVLIIGDSYRSSFTPVIANYFGEAHEVHFKNFQKHKIDLSEYKYIFVIQVERYLPRGFIK